MVNCRFLAQTLKVGDPRDPATRIGLMVISTQYQRVQAYIRKGIEEMATVGADDNRPRDAGTIDVPDAVGREANAGR